MFLVFSLYFGLIQFFSMASYCIYGASQSDIQTEQRGRKMEYALNLGFMKSLQLRGNRQYSKAS